MMANRALFTGVFRPKIVNYGHRRLAPCRSQERTGKIDVRGFIETEAP